MRSSAPGASSFTVQGCQENRPLVTHGFSFEEKLSPKVTDEVFRAAIALALARSSAKAGAFLRTTSSG